MHYKESAFLGNNFDTFESVINADEYKIIIRKDPEWNVWISEHLKK